MRTSHVACLRQASMAFAVLLATGCAGIAAPRGAVPMVDSAPKDGFGGWAAVWDAKKGYAPTFEGELIAVSPDSFFVLVGDSLVARSRSGVRKVRVVGYNPRAGDLQNWTLGGILGTASHGLVAFLSAPAWAFIGFSVTHAAAKASELNYPSRSKDWDDLRAYARFPQGFPPDFDRGRLKSRAVMGGSRR